MIYTSYFANIRNLPDSFEPVSIARWPPKWFKGHVFPYLAPPDDILTKYKRNGDKDYYVREYCCRVLDLLNPDGVVRNLHAMTNKSNIALLCYEKPGDFCHRHLVTDWLVEHGIECLEWNGKKGNDYGQI